MPEGGSLDQVKKLQEVIEALRKCRDVGRELTEDDKKTCLNTLSLAIDNLDIINDCALRYRCDSGVQNDIVQLHDLAHVRETGGSIEHYVGYASRYATRVWGRHRPCLLDELGRWADALEGSTKKLKDLQVDLEHPRIFLDGVPHSVTERQAEVVRDLHKAGGARVTGAQLKKFPGSYERIDEIIKALPDEIRVLIRSRRGHEGGYWLDLRT